MTGTVLALVGATGSTAITFVLPGFFYFYMTKPIQYDNHDGDDHSEDGDDHGVDVGCYHRWLRIAALLFGVMGLILMPICLVGIFI